MTFLSKDEQFWGRKGKKMECILRPIVSSAYKRVSLKMLMHGPF